MLRTGKISVKCLLNILRENDKKTFKILASSGQILFKILGLVRYCIESILSVSTGLKDTIDFSLQWTGVSQH